MCSQITQTVCVTGRTILVKHFIIQDVDYPVFLSAVTKRFRLRLWNLTWSDSKTSTLTRCKALRRRIFTVQFCLTLWIEGASSRSIYTVLLLGLFVGTKSSATQPLPGVTSPVGRSCYAAWPPAFFGAIISTESHLPAENSNPSLNPFPSIVFPPYAVAHTRSHLLSQNFSSLLLERLLCF